MSQHFSLGELEVSVGGTHFPMLTWDKGFYDFQVKLPSSLTCEQCIFQVSSDCFDWLFCC